jgi:predicted transcriptional regulator
MTAAAVAELLGITQQAVAKAVVRGGELADDQRYKLR